MFRKLGVFAILMTSLMSASAPAFTNTVVTDDELVTALRTLAKKNYSTTFARESANSWRIRTLLVSTAGIVGGSAAALLRYGNIEKLAEFTDIPNNVLRRAQTRVNQHGFKVAKGVTAFVLASIAAAIVYDHIDALNSAAVSGKALQINGVYRTELAQFFALDFQEQFLIARRDPDFASDLVNLAHAMEPKTKSYLWGIVKIQD